MTDNLIHKLSLSPFIFLSQLTLFIFILFFSIILCFISFCVINGSCDISFRRFSFLLCRVCIDCGSFYLISFLFPLFLTWNYWFLRKSLEKLMEIFFLASLRRNGRYFWTMNHWSCVVLQVTSYQEVLWHKKGWPSLF